MAGQLAGKGAPKNASSSLYERFGMPEHIRTNLHEIEWETLANMLHELTIKFDEKKASHRRLAKRIALTKIMLSDRIKHRAASGRMDTKLLVELVRLLEKCEADALAHEVDMSEFLALLYALVEKMKHEKICLYRSRSFPSELPLDEFGKLKGKSEASRKAK
ncbi:Uncharacterised protein [Candidatus Anstonella stagnisolia]|nr:Uncharacterised protein [Candidatus Anstonella stagnisolia]